MTLGRNPEGHGFIRVAKMPNRPVSAAEVSFLLDAKKKHVSMPTGDKRPQGLNPSPASGLNGTAEAMPFPRFPSSLMKAKC
jgi:hypothetical protein